MDINLMNHHNGTQVRNNFPIGTYIKFKPKGMIDGQPITGKVEGHIYVNVLIIKDVWERSWFVSSKRIIEILKY